MHLELLGDLCICEPLSSHLLDALKLCLPLLGCRLTEQLRCLLTNDVTEALWVNLEALSDDLP